MLAIGLAFAGASVGQVPADTTPPQLTSFGMTPAAIDTTSGHVAVTVTFSVTDYFVGATAFYVKFQSPSGEYRDNVTALRLRPP